MLTQKRSCNLFVTRPPTISPTCSSASGLAPSCFQPAAGFATAAAFQPSAFERRPPPPPASSAGRPERAPAGRRARPEACPEPSEAVLVRAPRGSGALAAREVDARRPPLGRGSPLFLVSLVALASTRPFSRSTFVMTTPTSSSPIWKRPRVLWNVTSLAKPAFSQNRPCSSLVTRPEMTFPTLASSSGRPPLCSQPSAGRSAAASLCSWLLFFSCATASFSVLMIPIIQPVKFRTSGCWKVSKNLSTLRLWTSADSWESRRSPCRPRPSSPRGTPRRASAVSACRSASLTMSW
mmetsp:Transcript_58417/g.181172  ORF Transcript_58417/g.181172 Transcript_58417/m.181172 type:complete len:294 (-) Transcript_58417:216-1097(-)